MCVCVWERGGTLPMETDRVHRAYLEGKKKGSETKIRAKIKIKIEIIKIEIE